MRGRFVVFEGIDGSGKSSALAHVAEALRARGRDVVVTREETEGPTGTFARQSIADGMDPLTTTYLFLADRAQHAKWIEAQLAAGKDVLCDRYYHSTLAYQSVTLADELADPLGVLRRLHEPIALLPDHVLLLDADAAVCVARTEARGETTRYEKVEFLARVQAAYRALAQEDDVVVAIDAGGTLEETQAAALARVEQWLDASA